jgi:hypothetical protein
MDTTSCPMTYSVKGEIMEISGERTLAYADRKTSICSPIVIFSLTTSSSNPGVSGINGFVVCILVFSDNLLKKDFLASEAGGSDNAKSFDNIALRSLCLWNRLETSTCAPKKYSISPVSLRKGATTSAKKGMEWSCVSYRQGV